ncbi:MAG TPA: SDR family NAD(P)-dependent oxidoreductase [Solirubrobacteraceae bacterium]|nr:SDR family NAD(P)-dependent oxidoreductase [Solirubrobacteraceae bacterium]
MTSVSGNALVTGATGGIGQAIARLLAARGATVTVTGRRVEVLEPLASEISGRAVVCDLSSRAEVDRLVQEAGQVDVLVANAALPGAAELTELTQDQIDEMLEVNLRAPIALARALVPPMVSRRRGHLVFISSLNSKAATPATSIYAAGKFGLRGFALCLREDLRPHGVGVSSVLPGFIRDAGMFADSQVDLPRGVGTRSPEDVAAAVVKAIEHNRAELEVAPLGLRLGATFAGVAPELAAAAARKLGSAQIAESMAESQRSRR